MPDAVATWRFVGLVAFAIVVVCIFAYCLGGFDRDGEKSVSAKPCYTHKGWFWFCPIYLAEDGAGFLVQPRWLICEPLFVLAALLDQLRIFASCALIPDYEPSFMFRITGKL